MSKLLSSQLSVPLGANNLIGIQALLRDFSEQNKVLKVTVYDVDNRILVQAGRIMAEQDNTKDFTHPINLDQTLLGSVTISLDMNTSQTGLIPLYFLVALLLTLALTATSFTIPSLSLPPNLTARDIEATNAATVETASSFLSIKLLNIEKLYQQLNAQTRQQELEKLQTAIHAVLKLYSGKQILACNDQVILSFESTSLHQAILHALCSAHLLQKTREQQAHLLAFNLTVSIPKQELNITSKVVQNRLLSKDSSQGNILIEQEVLELSQLRNRVIHKPWSVNPACSLRLIEGFDETYQQLLDKQANLIQQSE